jgi:hypothetical protein
LGLRVRLRVAGREADRDGDADRLRDRDRVRDRVRDGLRVAVCDALAVPPGGVYAHDRPVTAAAPGNAPTWIKYTRDAACASVTVDADGLGAHAGPLPASPALSLPARHCAGTAHVGQPRPTYSTVSSPVAPHVVTVRLPPSTVAGPRFRKYTSRGPAMNVENPDRQLPDVYMPALPYSATLAGGALPAGPSSVVTLRTGAPHMAGGVGDALRLPVPVVVLVGVAVLVRDDGGVRVADGVAEGVGGDVRVTVVGAVRDGVGVPPGVREPVAAALGDVDGEPLRSVSTLAPWNVMPASAASTSVAASHSAASTSPLAMPLAGTSCVTLTSR